MANKKILNKEYLEDSLYLYNKEYTQKKQNIIDNQSPHISLETKEAESLDSPTLNLKISNDNTRHDFDYLIAKGDGNSNTLKWITPVTESADVATKKALESKDKTLISAKALSKFTGTDNINTVGTITTGTWQAGEINTKNNITGNNITAKGNVNIAGELSAATFTIEGNTKSTNISAVSLTVSENAKIQKNLSVDKNITSDTITTNTETTDTLTANKTIKALKIGDSYNFTLDKANLRALVPNINLTGATVISSGSSSLSVNNMDGINLTGATVISSGSSSLSVNNMDGINLTGNNIKLNSSVVLTKTTDKNTATIKANNITISNENESSSLSINDNNSINLTGNTITIGKINSTTANINSNNLNINSNNLNINSNINLTGDIIKSSNYYTFSTEEIEVTDEIKNLF